MRRIFKHGRKKWGEETAHHRSTRGGIEKKKFSSKKKRWKKTSRSSVGARIVNIKGCLHED